MVKTKTNKDKVFQDKIIKLMELEGEFEHECDFIQIKTEKLLDRVPKNDIKRRGKILELHKEKLRNALKILNYKLSKLT